MLLYQAIENIKPPLEVRPVKKRGNYLSSTSNSGIACLQAVQRVQVENTGDVGTKYSLDMAALGPHFTAFPGSGFLAPNQQAQVEITFQPKALNPDIRVDRVCLPCNLAKHSCNPAALSLYAAFMPCSIIS